MSQIVKEVYSDVYRKHTEARFYGRKEDMERLVALMDGLRAIYPNEIRDWDEAFAAAFGLNPA